MPRHKKDIKPRLLLINHYASIPRWPGPTRNFDFAAALVKEGWQVTLMSCRFNHYLRGYLPKPPAEECGVRLKWVWSTPYQGNSLLRELNILTFSKLSFWRGLWQPVDVIVTVTPPLESAFAAWLLARVKRVPFVLDVEDLWPDSLITMGFKNKLVVGWLRFLERFLYRHADHFLAVADKMGEYLGEQGVPEAKIDIIPLGANLPEPKRNRAEVRRQYGWQDDQVVAVYVGAHGPANALETLIQAAGQLQKDPKIRIALFGDGSDKPRLKKLLNEAELSNIKLEDPVAPETVPEILNAADIGIASLKNTPTFQTVRPNKLYEYMAVGLPIACCIDGEARELISQIGSGIPIVPEDSDALAAALRKLADDDALRRKMGDNGRRFVIAEGDRVKLAQRMGVVLQKVIGD
jgi:glycosyltransferase involved in cell wall biosynthesis